LCISQNQESHATQGALNRAWPEFRGEGSGWPLSHAELAAVGPFWGGMAIPNPAPCSGHRGGVILRDACRPLTQLDLHIDPFEVDKPNKGCNLDADNTKVEHATTYSRL